MMSNDDMRVISLLQIAKSIHDIKNTPGLNFSEPAISIPQIESWLTETTRHCKNTFISKYKNADTTLNEKAQQSPLFNFASPYLWSYQDALLLQTIPQHLAIVGTSKQGLEIATIYQALGSKVTILLPDSSLIPALDSDINKTYQRYLKRQFKIYNNTTLHDVSLDEAGICISFTSKGKLQPTSCFDAVFVAQEETQTTVNDKNEIASPIIINTLPCVAWIGNIGINLTNQDLPGSAPEPKIINLPWRSLGRANTDINTNGLTQFAFNPNTDQLIGACVMGNNAEEVFGEICLAIAQRCTAQDIAKTVHAHPTLHESTLVTAEIYLGTATDVLPEMA